MFGPLRLRLIIKEPQAVVFFEFPAGHRQLAVQIRVTVEQVLNGDDFKQ